MVGADGGTTRRNPPWARDELILALDLYARRGALGATAPEVIELSELLNSLPIHADRPDRERFRNPNGVALKLANFVALDPAKSGRGMRRHGQGDVEVWDEFAGRRDELASIAEQLRAGVLAEYRFPDFPEPDEDGVPEGRLLYRRHRVRERDRSAVEQKKTAVLRLHGRLACEVCDLDFVEVYGSLGEGFAECHHRLPLAASGPTRTRPEDLAILCANCHRMIHRSRPLMLVSELRQLVQERRRGVTPGSRQDGPVSAREAPV